MAAVGQRYSPISEELLELLEASTQEVHKDPEIMLNELKELLDNTWASGRLSADDLAIVAGFVRAGLQLVQTRAQEDGGLGGPGQSPAA